MSQKINTGNYRISKNKTGIAKSQSTVLESTDLKYLQENLKTFISDLSYNYFIEEEVYYKGTLKDERSNPIDSIPGWVRR